MTKSRTAVIIGAGIGGMCAVGYWMTYDIKCFGGERVWVWTRIPPGFECRALF